MKTTLTLIIFMVISTTVANKDNGGLFLNERVNLSPINETCEDEEICEVIAPEDIIYREIELLHPAFRNKVILLFIEAKKQNIDLVISETYRTPERQNKFKKMKLTKLKGGRSKHQFGLAIDIIPVINGVSQHDNHEVMKRVGIIGERLGLRWGGRWKSLYDPVHFEWKCSSKDLANGWLPEIPDTILKPTKDLFYKPLLKK